MIRIVVATIRWVRGSMILAAAPGTCEVAEPSRQARVRVNSNDYSKGQHRSSEYSDVCRKRLTRNDMRHGQGSILMPLKLIAMSTHFALDLGPHSCSVVSGLDVLAIGSKDAGACIRCDVFNTISIDVLYSLL